MGVFFMHAHNLSLAIGFLISSHVAIGAVGAWFLQHRAIASHVANAGSSLGGVILPIKVNRLIVHKGFGWALRSTSFLFLGLLAIANFTIKSRLPPPHRNSTP